MLTKKITTLITAGSLTAMLALSPLSVFAQTVTPNPTRAARQAINLGTVISRSNLAVEQRLTSLNTVLTRINDLVKLSPDEKSQFSGEVTTDINGLTSLKNKIDTDADITTARSDYKTIYTTYRIYAEFLPQIHLLIASDTMGVTADKLSDLANKLQTRIQSAGNPSNLTSLLSDMQAKIADARTQYGNVQSQVTSLTPQSWNNDPTGTTATLKNARSEIQTGISDLKGAFADAKQIIQALQAMHTTPTQTQ